MIKHLIYILSISIVVASCSKTTADIVVYGTIRTAEKDKSVVEAVAIKDGKYIYVGDRSGVAAFIKKGFTGIIDHTGKGMVMPGCSEGHAHYLMGNANGYVSYMDGWSNYFGNSLFYDAAKKLDEEGKLNILLGMSYEIESSCKDVDAEIDKAVETKKYTDGHKIRHALTSNRKMSKSYLNNL